MRLPPGGHIREIDHVYGSSIPETLKKGIRQIVVKKRNDTHRPPASQRASLESSVMALPLYSKVDFPAFSRFVPTVVVGCFPSQVCI